MAPKQAKKRRKSTQSKPRQLKERRFVPEKAQTQLPVAVAGMVGAAALGAGVMGRFFLEPAPDYAFWLLVPGAALLAGALFWGDQSEPVRVGDVGVAIEKNDDVVRLPWCDMQRVHVEGGQLVLDGGTLVLKVPMSAHPLACAWILSEGQKRVPDVVDVKQSVARELPKPREKDGESMKVEDYQVAGRHCAASDEPISFAKDARLCPNCGQVYHRSHVAESCVTCDSTLKGREVRVPG